MRPIVLAAVIMSAALGSPSLAADPFEFKDGDRVVLLGGGIIERDQKYGWIEAAITSRYPDRHITFRNQGWSGDTVLGEARAYFGTPQDGFNHLKQYVQEAKPTVIILGYGSNESFAGPAGLEKFQKDYQTLLDAIKPAGARIVLLSPIPLFNLGSPLPDPAAANENLRFYAKTIQQIALNYGHRFVDLYHPMSGVDTAEARKLTDDGVLLNSAGYQILGQALAGELKLPPAADELSVDLSGTLKTIDATLPLTPGRKITAKGLAPGAYQLKIDGVPVAQATADQWASGVVIHTGPPFDRAEKLRRAIVEKDELFFHGYRPQNETYLRGFRKHEQGQNAVEIPQFVPLVESKEKQIDALKKPVKYTYEWAPIQGASK